MASLEATLIFHLSVDCAPAIEAGRNYEGCLFVIPLTGGSFSGVGMGEGIRGRVVPGGADWNTRYGPRAPEEVEASFISAEYLIETDGGVPIRVRNEGRKSWRPGEGTTIVTQPRFQVCKGKYEWLNYGVYVGTLVPRPDKTGVELDIYRMA